MSASKNRHRRAHIVLNAASRIRAVSKVCDKIFLSPPFLFALFVASCAISYFDKEVVGAYAFVVIICAALILCEDIFATTLPFLLLSVFVTKCYDSYDVFIKYVWVAIPALLSLLFHFIFYRKPIILGKTFPALIAVSVALIFGGAGSISAQDYFNPVALYYVVFLGLGMVVSYILIGSQMCAPRDYDTKNKLLSILYIMGLFAATVVLFETLDTLDALLKTHRVQYFQASNNLSTFLMIAMPCPFFYARKNRLHFISALIIMTALILTGSRGGLLFGAIEFILCLAIFSFFDKRNRLFYFIALGVTVVGALLFGQRIASFVLGGDASALISKTEARYKLIGRAANDFTSSPVFGRGLGYRGNTDLYNPKLGALPWYHMMIPQILASLGLVGVGAYLYQFALRLRAMLKAFAKPKSISICALSMSYIGLLLMSMVNPGLFCPIPYSLIAVIIFALIDNEDQVSSSAPTPQ